MVGCWIFFNAYWYGKLFAKNKFLSSTAIITYNEPFYQAGVKLSYDVIKNWYFELWAMNGYNNFVDNNDAKSFGLLASFNFSKNTSIIYTNLYGRESEHSAPLKQNRFYQNIYLNQNWNDKFYLTVGFDFGLQSNSDLKNYTESATMYGGMIIGRYQLNPKFSISGRAEIFNDENGFISGAFLNKNNIEEGLNATAITLGTEYKPPEKSYVRVEIRYVNAADDLEIFTVNNEFTNNRFELLFTIGVEFEKIFLF